MVAKPALAWGDDWEAEAGFDTTDALSDSE